MGKKKFKLPKPVTIYSIPLYGGSVYLYTDPERYEKALHFLGGGEVDELDNAVGKVCVLEDDEGIRIYLMGVFDGHTNTLSHETFHCVIFVLDNAGFSAHAANSEPGAYLMGDMFSYLGAEMVKHKSKKTT